MAHASGRRLWRNSALVHVGRTGIWPGRQGRVGPKQPPNNAKAKRVLHIFLQGAAPHMDLWDPRPELNKSGGKQTGNRKLLASPFKFPKFGKSGLQMSEIWPNIGRHADDIAIIRSLYTDAPAHGPATYMMNTGEMQEIRPAVGSWALYGLGTENQNLPGFITMRPGNSPDARNYTNAFLPGAFQGTFVDSNNTKIEDIIKNIKSDFASRKDQRKQLDLLLKLNEIHKQKRQAEGALEARINTFELAYRMQTDAREAFDIAGEKPETRAKYGDNGQGRQLLIARRLLERGVRFVQVSQGGWDLHNGIANRAARNAQELDPAVGALMDDLKERGLFEDTLIYISSEFGRSPTEDGGGGRSHNARGMSTVLAGGGIKGGLGYGSTDELGGSAVKNKVHVKGLARHDSEPAWIRSRTTHFPQWRPGFPAHPTHPHAATGWHGSGRRDRVANSLQIKLPALSHTGSVEMSNANLCHEK